MKENIFIGKKREHSKASEVYIEVKFKYPKITLNWDIPIEYRRTGTHFAQKSDQEIREYLLEIYNKCNPKNWELWKKEQINFWKTKPNAGITKSIFDKLNKEFKWIPANSFSNPNYARRIQDIKEFGYTLATNTNKLDEKTNKKTTHLLLLPIPRGGITGYEIWTKEERERIIKTLKSFDAFEGKVVRKESLLPDHKFPEIRWDKNTKRDNLSNLSEKDILHDFQLLNNQRNQQKREVCRTCYQTGKRGIAYGINFFYKGTSDWDKKYPTKGKAAEKGCIGCAWYDFNTWRESLNKLLVK